MDAVGVEKLGGAGAQDLEAIVEVAPGGEILCAEAGAGVVDFEEVDGVAGAIADCGLDVGGVTAGGGEAGENGEREQRTHKDQAYQGGWCVELKVRLSGVLEERCLLAEEALQKQIPAG